MSRIGLDVLAIDRLERALQRRPGLAERVFSEGERRYAAERRHTAMHLAARFCAKEAVAKALGLDIWSFRDVEVVTGARGPEVRLRGGAAARAQELGVVPVVSLTHERTIAAAAAMLVPRSDPARGA